MKMNNSIVYNKRIVYIHLYFLSFLIYFQWKNIRSRLNVEQFVPRIEIQGIFSRAMLAFTPFLKVHVASGHGVFSLQQIFYFTLNEHENFFYIWLMFFFTFFIS